VKGTSDMGYTAITPVGNIPDNAKIVVKEPFCQCKTGEFRRT
jgi:hypothetical protein